MGMKTVDELVSEWTPEEREKTRDLIQECRERERELIENSKVCFKNLSELSELLSSLFSNSYKIKEKLEGINEEMWGIYLHLYNKEMPTS